MRARLHLISMPWAEPLHTSIQLGSLKAYVDRTLSRQIRTRNYSAYLGIPLLLKGKDVTTFYDGIKGHGEELYFLLFMQRFGSKTQIEALRKRMPQVLRKLNAMKPAETPITPCLLSGLDRATRTYLDTRIAPHLSRTEMNIVGFSVISHQFYASLYGARYLRSRRPDARMLFLFGGDGVTAPVMRRTLWNALRVDALCVRGEGERKLEAIARAVLAEPEGTMRPDLPGELSAQIPDVYVLSDNAAEPWPGRLNPAGQVNRMEDLPLPDYTDYFEEIRRATTDRSAYLELKTCRTFLLAGGSRGCSGTCQFCAENRNWHGCRTKAPAAVVRDIAELRARYGVESVILTDNSCDAWAGRYADEIIRTGVVNDIRLMELRSRHPESFWIKLSLTGLSVVQLGVESLSTPLLRVMRKGCTALDNLRSLKWLKELDIASLSNLIVHHPGSTLADIRETRRVLALIPHLHPLRLSYFTLGCGAPLYEQIEEEEKRNLRPMRSATTRGRWVYPSEAGADVLEYFGNGLDFDLPRRLKLDPQVRRAWTCFSTWYQRHVEAQNKNPCSLTVQRIAPNLLYVFDARYGRRKEYRLRDADAAIYEACHAGLTVGELCRETGCSRPVVVRTVRSMVDARLMIQVDGHFLSLALRPRDRLIAAGLLNRASASSGPQGVPPDGV